MSLSVPRTRVEEAVQICVENDLLDTGRLIEVAERFHAAAASAIVVDHAPRIAELEREIRNVGDAIAKGLFSDELARRLKATEAERTRLLAVQAKPLPTPRKLSVGDIERLRGRHAGPASEGRRRGAGNAAGDLAE